MALQMGLGVELELVVVQLVLEEDEGLEMAWGRHLPKPGKPQCTSLQHCSKYHRN
jgi:hypothetical protein